MTFSRFLGLLGILSSYQKLPTSSTCDQMMWSIAQPSFITRWRVADVILAVFNTVKI